MTASTSKPISSEEVVAIVVRAVIGAVVATIIAHLFAQLTHTVDPHVAAPIAGGAGFTINGWKIVAPILTAIVIGAVIIAGIFILASIIFSFACILICL